MTSTFGERLSELLRPRAYPHAARDIRLIETHISWVFLAGAFAYKVRKPVDFGFLDFTSLHQRRADCDAEVALNRRLCADLYLGVVDVVERNGQLYMGGGGEPVEAAVAMRRLPESGMLPALLARGAAGERLIERVAKQLADFHQAAPTGPGVDEYGTAAAVRANWTENFIQIEPFVERSLDAPTREAIKHYVDDFLARELDLLDQRVLDGRIRDGHGDLHANSVCLKSRRLYLFDCIEFNTRFRCADVAADVAFLAMDLDHFGRADLAQTFVDAYVQRSRDPHMLAVLQFYKCYRAFVRGKVLSFRLNEPGIEPADARQIAGEARAYFDLARSYAQDTVAPVVLVIMGLPASGKTTVARAVARRLGMVHLSSDIVRKRLAGLRPTTHMDEPFERGLYSRSMSRRTYAALRRHAARWLRRGHSVVVDATYGQPAERAAIRQVALRTGSRLIFIECRADDDTLRARLAARTQTPDRISDARLDLWQALRGAFTPPNETTDTLIIDTTRPLEQALDGILDAVRRLPPRTLRAA